MNIYQLKILLYAIRHAMDLIQLTFCGNSLLLAYESKAIKKHGEDLTIKEKLATFYYLMNELAIDISNEIERGREDG